MRNDTQSLSKLATDDLKEQLSAWKQQLTEKLSTFNISISKTCDIGELKFYISDDFKIYNLRLEPYSKIIGGFNSRGEAEIAITAYHAKITNDKLAEALNSFLLKCNIPKRVIHTFKDIDTTAMRTVNEWLTLKQKDGLLLYGATGVGKTQSSRTIGRYCFIKNHSLQYATFKDLITLSINDRCLFDNIVRKSDYLIIDELILDTNKSNFYVETLQEILERRDNDMTKTIIITNVPNLKDHLLTPTIDRIKTTFQHVKIAEASIRGGE